MSGIVILYSLVSVIIVSLISLVGVFTLSLKDAVLKKYVFVFVSLAVGALLGDAFLHLIGESFETLGDPLLISGLVLSGILVFFILEKFLHWHHHGRDVEECCKTHHLGKMILVSDGLHNMIDGLIIGASYMVSIPAGIATTIAVMLHEIPQEIGDFAVLLHAGYSRKRALWLNFLSALTAVAGLALAIILGSFIDIFTNYFLPFAAGGFIYIAMSDLVPELHKEAHSWQYNFVQIGMVMLGIGLMALLLLIG